MKKLILVLLCALLLVIPVSAEPEQAKITSYETVCTVSDTGACDVTSTIYAEFPENMASLLLPLPLEAEQIHTPGFDAEQTVSENCIYLILTKPETFSSDVITVSYRLPQLVESWDRMQTMTLPLLFDDWNCQIAYYQLQLNLPKEFQTEPSILDADGDPIKNLFSVTTEGSSLTLESSGRSFTAQTTVLEMVFNDGYFTLSDTSSYDEISNVTRIDSLQTECTVLEDSSCFVSVSAQYTFRDNPSVVRIPVPRQARDITVGAMKFSKKRAADCTVLLLKNPAGFSGTQTFDISYSLLTTATEQNDAQHFSLPLVYPQWEYNIQSFRFSLLMPYAFEGLPVFVSSYYNDQIDNYLDIEISDGTLLAQSLQPLMEQESLAVNLSLPKGFFDLRFLRGRFSVAETILFWVITLLCGLYWFFFLRIRRKRISPETIAPLGCTAGQLPYLLSLKPTSFGLTVFTWASIGYLLLERTKSRQLRLLQCMDMRNERSRCETQLFSVLFARKTECSAKSTAFQTAASHCDALTAADWQSRLLPRHSRGNPLILKILGVIASAFACFLAFDRLITPQSFRWLLIIPLAIASTFISYFLQQTAGLFFARHTFRYKLIACAVLLYLMIIGIASGCFWITLLNCLLQLFISLALLPGAKRSSGGTELFYQLLGLRKYLRKLSVAEAEALLENDAQYYYRVLPYAEALGVGQQFTKKFESFSLEPCHWLNWKGQTIDRAQDFYQRFSLLLDQMDGDKKSFSR